MSTTNIARELGILRAMSSEIFDYVLSNSLFWQMQAYGDFPQLSLGMLLLTRAKLTAVAEQLSDSQRADFESATQKIDATLAKWAANCEKKAGQELRSRTNLWEQFIKDCVEKPGACGDNYPVMVNHRTIASLLQRQYTALANSPEAERLPALDALLQPRITSGAFIWPDDLATAFPAPEFWFLHGRPA